MDPANLVVCELKGHGGTGVARTMKSAEDLSRNCSTDFDDGDSRFSEEGEVEDGCRVEGYGKRFLCAGSLNRFGPRKELDSQCEEVEPME